MENADSSLLLKCAQIKNIEENTLGGQVTLSPSSTLTQSSIFFSYLRTLKNPHTVNYLTLENVTKTPIFHQCG